RRVRELHERHEDGPRLDGFRHPHEPRQLSAARRDAHALAGLDAEPSRIGGMDRGPEPRRQLEETLHAAGDRAAVPVIQEPTGVEDERVIGIGQLRGFDGLHGRDEPTLAAWERLPVEESRTGMLRRRARPLDTALAIEAIVREPAEE